MLGRLAYTAPTSSEELRKQKRFLIRMNNLITLAKFIDIDDKFVTVSTNQGSRRVFYKELIIPVFKSAGISVKIAPHQLSLIHLVRQDCPIEVDLKGEYAVIYSVAGNRYLSRLLCACKE